MNNWNDEVVRVAAEGVADKVAETRRKAWLRVKDLFAPEIQELIVEARIDELQHIDDPVNVQLYHEGLISVDDRIEALKSTQPKTEVGGE